MNKKTPKVKTSIRLSEEGKWLVNALSSKMGISLTAVLEVAVRKLALEWKLEIPKSLGKQKKENSQ